MHSKGTTRFEGQGAKLRAGVSCQFARVAGMASNLYTNTLEKISYKKGVVKMENFVITLTTAETRAITKMSRKAGNSDESHEQFLKEFINSAIKSRLKATFLSDVAKASLVKNYDKAAIVSGGEDKMAITRVEYMRKQLADATEIYNELVRGEVID
jgi:hypothetical protein